MKNLWKLFAVSFLFSLAFSSCEKDSFSDPLTLEKDQFQGVDADASYFGGPWQSPGAVYIMDNDPAGNNLLVFTRNADGSLGTPQTFSTGGAGTGGGLGSQGSIITDGQFVFVCNAGSNEISVFEKKSGGLRLVNRVNSKGTMPTSLTISKRILYVLNAGGTGNISGFRLDYRGRLRYIQGSTQSLSTSGSAPAQVSFNLAGNQLIVTERATNMITTFPVNRYGMALAGSSTPSAGITPFGFDFGKRGELIISEAFGGAPNASALSSYKLEFDGDVELITGPIATNQTAACWVVVTNNGRYAYTTNTGSASVSGYRISHSGELELLDPSGVSGQTGAGPLDMDLSRNSQYLYTINVGANSISIFKVEADGSLTNAGEVTDLPDSSLGLAAE